jgi:adenylate cyclase
MRAQTWHYSRHVLVFTILSIVIGAVLGSTEAREGGDHLGFLRGAITGGLICFVLASIEVFVLAGFWSTTLRRVPFALQILSRACLYAVVILAGLAAGPWLIPLGPGAVPVIHARDLWWSVGLSIGFNMMIGINQLLGPGVLLAFVAGRYHQPRIEQRIVLFLDMESSTTIAERLGELRFLTLLNRFVGDVTTAITRQGGQIHKYVGDEVIATWKPRSGGRNARCVAACFDALDMLDEAAAEYETELGAAARFRAGLHYGPVVIGELGIFKMEIALLGDTMNTAARIQAACRVTGNRILASAALVERLETLPDGITQRSLGTIDLRGKATGLELFALEAAAPARAGIAAADVVTSAA